MNKKGFSGAVIGLLLMIIGLIFIIGLISLIIIHILTAETKYIETLCVDGDDAINLEGLKCEKEIPCNGFPSFNDDSRCSEAYDESQIGGRE